MLGILLTSGNCLPVHPRPLPPSLPPPSLLQCAGQQPHLQEPTLPSCTVGLDIPKGWSGKICLCINLSSHTLLLPFLRPPLPPLSPPFFSILLFLPLSFIIRLSFPSLPLFQFSFFFAPPWLCYPPILPPKMVYK